MCVSSCMHLSCKQYFDQVLQLDQISVSNRKLPCPSTKQNFRQLKIELNLMFMRSIAAQEKSGTFTMAASVPPEFIVATVTCTVKRTSVETLSHCKKKQKKNNPQKRRHPKISFRSQNLKPNQKYRS